MSEAAGAAIRAGAALGAIADAEQHARDELGADILRKVERAAKRKREAHTDTDHDHAIERTARLGLSHRENRHRRPGHARHRPRHHHPRRDKHGHTSARRGQAKRWRAGDQPLAEAPAA